MKKRASKLNETTLCAAFDSFALNANCKLNELQWNER